MKKHQFKSGNIILGTTALSTLIALAGCGGGGGSMGGGMGMTSSGAGAGSVAIQMPTRNNATNKFTNVTQFTVTLAGQSQQVSAGNVSQLVDFDNVPAGPQTLVVSSVTSFGTAGPGTVTSINVVANTTTSVTATLATLGAQNSLNGNYTFNTFETNSTGDWGRVSGELSFDGRGNCTLNANTEFDGIASPTALGSGTYSVQSNGSVTANLAVTSGTNNVSLTLIGHVNDQGDVFNFTEQRTDNNGEVVGTGMATLDPAGTGAIPFGPFLGVSVISDGGGVTPAQLSGGADVAPVSAGGTIGPGILGNILNGSIDGTGSSFSASITVNTQSGNNTLSIPALLGGTGQSFTGVSAGLDTFSGIGINTPNNDKQAVFLVNDPGTHTVTDMVGTYGVEIFIPNANGNVSGVFDGAMSFDGAGNITAFAGTIFLPNGNSVLSQPLNFESNGNHTYQFSNGNISGAPEVFVADIDLPNIDGGTQINTIAITGGLNPRNNVLTGQGLQISGGGGTPATVLLTQ